ncbi:hypothetical protein D3C72_2165030 [compost metagenome]
MKGAALYAQIMTETSAPSAGVEGAKSPFCPRKSSKLRGELLAESRLRASVSKDFKY